MPYRLAFTLDGRSPRVLEAQEETSVPLTLTNTGQQTWDPARVHFSYHWLWLVPRELARRSRTVPYQEGIRTELRASMAPGARTTIEARLLAPGVPGVYWLQWDMLEEGVTWFAQVELRQPRRLVVVLPTPAGFFAPLPFIVVIAGLIWYRRFEAADVVWCSLALLAKQLILFQQTLLEPTPVTYWLTVGAAVVPPLLLWVVLPRRVRAPMLFVLGAFGSVVVLADIVYYRFFGDVLSMPALLGIRQTGQVSLSIQSLFSWDLAWLLVDLPFACWLVVRILGRGAAGTPMARRLVWAAWATGVIAVLAAPLSAARVLAAVPFDQMFRDRAVVEQLGAFGFHAYDAWNYLRSASRPKATDAEVQQVASWFAERGPLRAGPPSAWFGRARGRNLIVLQVESLQDFAVDYEVAGQDAMPHLRRWSKEALRFTNVTDQTSEGRTSDAEFVAMTSLLPLDHGAVVFRYPGNHYVALPRVLSERGYATLSAVPFEAGFWNRRVMHPSYGFKQSLFEPDFTLTEQIGWGLNDRDFLRQMITRLEQLPRPFCAWLITLSLHHPFEGFPDRHKVLKLGALEGTSFGNYLHTMHFFDQAFAEFIQALRQDGLLDDSVIAIFGDHDAGFARSPALAATIGIPPTDIDWTLSDRVPFFIRAPHVFETLTDAPHVIATPAGQADFAPTLLALVGIDPAPLPYAGRNLLGAPDNPPLLRPYGDWIDAAHLSSTKDGYTAAATCFSIAKMTVVDDADCQATGLAARAAREVLRKAVTNDLQERLRGSMSQMVQ